MTKQEILETFNDIDFVYNDSSKHETLSRMLDELLKDQEVVQPKTIPDKLKHKMWNALYAEEDKFEEKYIGTKDHDSWFLIYRPWLQAGFEIAITAIADYEDLVRNAPAVGDWISVKDRLPDENVAVNIVWVNTDPEIYYEHIRGKPFTATGVYFRGEWYWWSSVVQDCLSEYGVGFTDKMDKAIVVTHWMPLPEPPEEVSVDD